MQSSVHKLDFKKQYVLRYFFLAFRHFIITPTLRDLLKISTTFLLHPPTKRFGEKQVRKTKSFFRQHQHVIDYHGWTARPCWLTVWTS